MEERIKSLSFLKKLNTAVREARHHGRKNTPSKMPIGVKIPINHPRPA